MTFIPEFQDALMALPSVIALEALLPGGIESLPEDIYDALRHDDVRRAMEAGESWYRQGEGSEEMRALTYAILQEGVDLLEEADDFVQQVRQEYPDSPQLLLAEAEIALERTDDERAGRLLDTFWEEHLEGTEVDGPVWGFAGDLMLDLERDDRALEAYEKAVSLGAEHFETVIRLAQMQRGRQNWERAAESFELAAELGGDVVGPWAQAADCWRQAGQLRRSLQARQHVLDQRGGDAEQWAKQGVGYGRLGEFDRAIEALEKATRLDAHRPEYWIELAHLRRRSGQSEEAIAGYRRVLEQESGFLEALHGLTAAALDQGDVALAEETARQAVDHDPGPAQGWYLLGRTLRQAHRSEEALDAIRRALDRDETVAEYHKELGELLLDAGKTDEGWNAMEEAIALSDDPDTLAAPFAEALLRTKQYDRLNDLVERVDQPEEVAPQWALTAPMFLVILDGVDSEQGRDVDGAIEAFGRAVKAHREALPLEDRFEELARYALVVDDHHQWIVETMIAIVEGRESLDTLIPEGSEPES
jgi:tetratricopeptide (TPR) repeat protein